MHWQIEPRIQLALLIAAMLAACAAAVLLGCEFLGGRWKRTAPAAVAGFFTAVTVAGWLLGMPGWLVLAGASGTVAPALALAASWPTGRQVLAGTLQPKVIWSLVLCVSLLASRLLATTVLSAVQPTPAKAEMDLADVPVVSTEAITDQGRHVSLFHFKMHSGAETIQQFVAQNEKDHAQLIRLMDVNPASNCHGWVFTGGRYGIRDPEVAAILNDNGYAEVALPREGDLAVYRRGNDICHSGRVRMADKPAPVLIESKWGPLGVYLHATDVHPFGGECRFYRSARQSHALVLRPASSAAATASVAAPGKRTN